MEDMNNNFEHQQQAQPEQPKNEQTNSSQGFAQYDDPAQNGNNSYNYQPFTAQQQNGYAQPQLNNDASASKAKVSMILGIISAAVAFMCSCFPVSIGLGIAAIILAVKSKKLSADNKLNGMATAGLICGIVGLALGVLYILIYGFLVVLMVMFPEIFEESATFSWQYNL